jgi:hypothetical protein
LPFVSVQVIPQLRGLAFKLSRTLTFKLSRTSEAGLHRPGSLFQ